MGHGSELNHDSSHRPADHRVHRHPRVGDGSVAQDNSSHRRAGDRDYRRPVAGGDSACHDGGSRRGAGDAEGSGTTPTNRTGGRGNRGKGCQSSSDGRNRHRNRSRGDAYGVSSSNSFTDGSRRATVPEITGISSKRQVLPSLTGFSSSGDLLGRLTMSDDHAMPVSSNLAHARASAINSAAAVAAAKHTADVKRAYKHPGSSGLRGKAQSSTITVHQLYIHTSWCRLSGKHYQGKHTTVDSARIAGRERP